MGWDDFDQAVDEGSIILKGPLEHIRIAKDWLGQSTVAHIAKKSAEQQINY